MTWFQQRQRAIGIGVTISALALLSIAVVLGWALFTKEQPSTAGPGSSSEPSSSAVPSPLASATPTLGPTPTAVPTPGFEAPAGILPPNSRAVVVVDALHVRSEPRLDAEVVATLPAAKVVELGFGPTAADGIDWYPVVYQADPYDLVGYAAAGADGDRYLELLPARCEDADPDLAALMSITAWERLACFGNRSITVRGTYGCPVCGIAYPVGGYEPAWLANPDTLAYLGWPDVITLHLRPEAGLMFPPNASIVQVTAHFSDPASSTCVIHPTMEGVEIGAEVDPVIAELWCREQFVVDAYEIIGTDPDFTYSFPPA